MSLHQFQVYSVILFLSVGLSYSHAGTCSVMKSCNNVLFITFSLHAANHITVRTNVAWPDSTIVRRIVIVECESVQHIE